MLPAALFSSDFQGGSATNWRLALWIWFDAKATGSDARLSSCNRSAHASLLLCQGEVDPTRTRDEARRPGWHYERPLPVRETLDSLPTKVSFDELYGL